MNKYIYSGIAQALSLLVILIILCAIITVSIDVSVSALSSIVKFFGSL